MARKTIFTDENENELEVYVNDQGKLFLNAGRIKEDYYNGYITLDKEDVEELIKMLQEMKEEMLE